MSKIKKAKKARRPNIPMEAGPVVKAAGGGTETVAEVRAARPSGRAEPATLNFDYSHIQKDLTRIFTLAGIFIVVLVGLSFILK